MFKVNADIHPNIVKTFFTRDDAVAFLVGEGAVNGIAGWHRPLRDGETRKVSNSITEGAVFYHIRDERGCTVTL